LTFEDEDFDVSIIVVATEGEDRYSNKKTYRPCKRKHTVVERRICIQRVFAYFNYSYAASIHKAQGSTINHVFIIEDDILEVKLTTTKEKLQSINVGISRASYRAYIYNKIYKVDNSNLDKNYFKWMYHERG
jgi:ATP-dependent exoDNAse (exonuclease V) alpha subunit